MKKEMDDFANAIHKIKSDKNYGKKHKIITNQYPLNVSRYNNINTLRAVSAIGIVLMHYTLWFRSQNGHCIALHI